MRLDAKCLKLCGCGFGASWIVTTVEVSVDRQAGLSSGGANEVEDLVIAVERFAGPVLGDLREEPMLDGVPFRSSHASYTIGISPRNHQQLGVLNPVGKTASLL